MRGLSVLLRSHLLDKTVTRTHMTSEYLGPNHIDSSTKGWVTVLIQTMCAVTVLEFYAMHMSVCQLNLCLFSEGQIFKHGVQRWTNT